MKTRYYLLLLLTLFLTIPGTGYADGPGDGAGPAFENPAPADEAEEAPVENIASPLDPQDTPIDGGLTLLLAAGTAYGVKKYRDGRKRG